VIESRFSAVNLRTDAARRIKTRKSALFLFFKLLLNQASHLREIRACRLVARIIEQRKTQKNQRKVRLAACNIYDTTLDIDSGEKDSVIRCCHYYFIRVVEIRNVDSGELTHYIALRV
jgi:hypothetical protein